jgi:hypothetical protein
MDNKNVPFTIPIPFTFKTHNLTSNPKTLPRTPLPLTNHRLSPNYLLSVSERAYLVRPWKHSSTNINDFPRDKKRIAPRC